MRNRSAQSRKKPGARFRRRSSDTTRACSLSLYSVSTSYRWIRSVLNSIELLYRNREITVQFYKHVLQAENKVSNPTTTIVPIVSFVDSAFETKTTCCRCDLLVFWYYFLPRRVSYLFQFEF